MRAVCSLMAVGSAVGMALADGGIAKTFFFAAATLAVITALAIQLRRETEAAKLNNRLDA